MNMTKSLVIFVLALVLATSLPNTNVLAGPGSAYSHCLWPCTKLNWETSATPIDRISAETCPPPTRVAEFERSRLIGRFDRNRHLRRGTHSQNLLAIKPPSSDAVDPVRTHYLHRACTSSSFNTVTLSNKN
ncbi:unnamed protein product [Cochlearia groenlandica]